MRRKRMMTSRMRGVRMRRAAWREGTREGVIITALPKTVTHAYNSAQRVRQALLWRVANCT